MDTMQKLPCSEESERLVLGWAISNAEGFKTVCAGLQKEDFYFWQHQTLFFHSPKAKRINRFVLVLRRTKKTRSDF